MKNKINKKDISRRSILAGMAGVAGTIISKNSNGNEIQTSSDRPFAPNNPEKVTANQWSTKVGKRSVFEKYERHLRYSGTSSRSPLHQLTGTITPSDLHFERHHAGVPLIDPVKHKLIIHGMVDRPLSFTVDDLKRFPAVSRICFIECSGNLAREADEYTTPQIICGMTSQSEWTGVLLSTLMREVGVKPSASWFLAEGSDAAVLTRSIPKNIWNESIIAYAQNGEAVRPENGYPIRLLNPGYEGNTSVKWLRRMEFSDKPFMTREETSKYTETIKGGKARQFSLVMDARSIITYPAYPDTVEKGWIELQGIAWSGRGKIAKTEVSIDSGKTWHAANLQEPILSKAHTRFRYLFKWDGKETIILSRAIDETGYTQPDRPTLIKARGAGSIPYHSNPITGWRLRKGGDVVYRVEDWG
jgi:sulfane dehydrogenase subunit SoxC